VGVNRFSASSPESKRAFVLGVMCHPQAEVSATPQLGPTTPNHLTRMTRLSSPHSMPACTVQLGSKSKTYMHSRAGNCDIMMDYQRGCGGWVIASEGTVCLGLQT